MASIGIAQGPLYDKITVNLPYSINVNGTVLPPGDYEIRQFESSAGASRIVHFFSNGGMKLETTAMGIPALENRTQEDTRLILEHLGSDYYLNKIWVQGKDYGYEFPLPESIRNREKERNSTAIVAQYQPSVTTTTTTTTKTEQTEAAQVTPPAEPQREPEAVPAPAPAPVEQAQVQPAPAPVEAAPAPAPAPVEAAPAPAPMAADRTMPETAGNWLNLLLGGGLLTGSGLALRRIRA